MHIKMLNVYNMNWDCRVVATLEFIQGMQLKSNIGFVCDNHHRIGLMSVSSPSVELDTFFDNFKMDIKF